MTHLTLGLLAALATAQTGHRPSFAAVASDSGFVHLELTWRASTDRRGNAYAEYQWEARDRNDLLANGTVAGLVDTVLVPRPDPGDTVWLRAFVRGVDATGRPGGWGWASVTFMITNAAAESAPGGPPPPGPEEATRWQAPPVAAAAHDTVPRGSAADSASAGPVEDSVPGLPSGPPLQYQGGSHEPDGYVTIVGRRFDSRAESNGDRGRGQLPYRTGGSEGFDGVEYRYRALAIAADPTAPISPPNVAGITYREGFGGGSAPATLQTQPDGWTSPSELYIRYALKVSPEFFGHRTTTNKLFHYWSGGNRIFDRLVGSGRGALQYQIAKQGDEPPCQTAKPRPSDSRLGPNRGNGRILRGRWYVVEVQLILNTPGRCDGTVRAWIDGRQVIDYDDVGIRLANEHRLRWEQVQLSPTWGGTGSTAPNTFTLWIDDIYLSGR